MSLCRCELQAYEVWQEHGEWVSNNSPDFGPGISQRFTAASKITKEQVCGDKVVEGFVVGFTWSAFHYCDACQVEDL